jgi:cbb3-type cytochrome oxidase subunit 3
MEVLAVIAIILILLGIGYGAYTIHKKNAAKQKTDAILALTMNAAQVFFEITQTYPYDSGSNGNASTSSSGLLRCLRGELTADPVMAARIKREMLPRLSDFPPGAIDSSQDAILDSWGTPLKYSASQGEGGLSNLMRTYNKVQLFSAGPDKQWGTSDDIAQSRY